MSLLRCIASAVLSFPTPRTTALMPSKREKNMLSSRCAHWKETRQKECGMLLVSQKKWEKRKKKAKREPFCKQFEIFGLCFVRLTNVMERSRRRFVARDERKSETHCRERSKEIHSIMYYLRYRVGVYLWPEHRLMLADFRFISCTRKKKCKSISKRDENVRNWISFWEHRVALCNEGIFFN